MLERVRSELAFARGLLRTLRRTKPVAVNRTRTLRDLAEDLAARYGDRVALTSERETLTYRAWNARANRYARWARAQGIGKGDVVALLMPNRPEYLAVWTGIAKAGGVTALVNTNLAGASLAHSVNIVGAKLAIVDAALLDRYREAADGVAGAVPVWVHGEAEASAHPRLDAGLERWSGDDLAPDERVPLTINDRCIFIYTSGTTGLPKAANINHYRVQLVMHAFAAVTNSTADDRVYDALPMYHSNGGLIAPGMALTVGGTCVIRERFSAQTFFPDIARHNCTMFVYIGEVCRYVLATPPNEADRSHRVRLCVGNGLRPDVWHPFRDRFGLPNIVEFYSATEGNCTVFNLDSRPGAVGRIPKWVAGRFPVRIVDVDPVTEQVVRGPDGRCRQTPVGQAGELVGEILDDPAKPGNRFEGYSDRGATEAKVLRDAFKPGDAWFRSGDLMRQDARGYFYFVDRIGDTFRWKGENVATAEVAEAIGRLPGIRDVCVYGVRVPGREGRAGMASLLVDDPHAFDHAALRDHVGRMLPDYAWPLFLRFPKGLELTGTFKQRKTDLIREAYDPGLVRDPLFMLAPDRTGYVALDAARFAGIGSGAIRI